jgi:hypothetical protein
MAREWMAKHQQWRMLVQAGLPLSVNLRPHGRHAKWGMPVVDIRMRRFLFHFGRTAVAASVALTFGLVACPAVQAAEGIQPKPRRAAARCWPIPAGRPLRSSCLAAS